MAKRKVDGFTRNSVIHAFWDVSTPAKLKQAQIEYDKLYDATRNKARRAERNLGVQTDVRRLVRYQLEAKENKQPLPAQAQLVLNVNQVGQRIEKQTGIPAQLRGVMEWTKRFVKDGIPDNKNAVRQRAFELIEEQRKMNAERKQLINADKTLSKEEKKAEIKKLKDITPEQLYARLRDYVEGEREKRRERRDKRGGTTDDDEDEGEYYEYVG